ncbi:hypothetical protein Vadar_032765 [Vaccinium darrowii]|uniref:Uncharacterized protein n=1 Tax=Vaccinium darrowii TaxID=229202 RepID=A0ACB7XEC3_9ERIC|nr:hypothetical protein Vadar_032765 [Vaccinium darrowii]
MEDSENTKCLAYMLPVKCHILETFPLDNKFFNFSIERHSRKQWDRINLSINFDVEWPESIADAKRKKKMAVIVVVVVVCTVLGMIISATIGYYICQLRKAKIKAGQENIFFKETNEESQDNDFDLPIFDLGTIFSATDKFSSGKKIGQGGFGSVYEVRSFYGRFPADE